MSNLDWMDRGLCVTHPNPDMWFPKGIGMKGRQQRDAATRVCAACPVKAECREHKKHTGAAGGVWGGRTGPAKATSASQGGPQNKAPHGTEARARRHRRDHEELCAACQKGERLARARRGGASEIGSKEESGENVRTYAEIMATARDEPPFSNGTECDAWMENWCWRPCHNPAEKTWQDYEDGKRKHPHKDYPGGCPLIMAALNGKTPTEWLEQDSTDGIRLGDQFHCIEFQGPGGGGSGEPRPKCDPPGMDGLFERPERRVRMLQQPEPVREVVRV